MDTLSVKDVADQLATSVPRVRRAIERLELVPLTSPAGIRLDGEQFELLRRHLGYAPPEPDVA
ncbi:MAG: hypothetical protein ACRDWW_10615, partial [Acidimicrobiales bacterium]